MSEPFEPTVIVRTVIIKNPSGGPPIDMGVVQRITTQEHEPAIIEWFSPLIAEEDLPAEVDRAAVARWKAKSRRINECLAGTREVDA